MTKFSRTGRASGVDSLKAASKSDTLESLSLAPDASLAKAAVRHLRGDLASAMAASKWAEADFNRPMLWR